MTINARGFSARKREFIFDYVRNRSVDICCVQETFLSGPQVFQSLASQWRGPCYWSPAPGRQAGVIVLLSERFDGHVVSWKRDSNGRVISLLVKYNGVNYNVVNVYAPTVPSERNAFLQSVHRYFFTNSCLIMGGDFNCYDSVSDKFGGNPITSKEFSRVKSCFKLIDAWRAKNPRSSQFTWFSSDLSVASRLDTFLIDRDLRRFVNCCMIYPCAFSDHDYVLLDLDTSQHAQHGPGLWKFNSSLLSDDNYVSVIHDLIDRFLEFQHVFSSVKSFWDSLKLDIKQESIFFASAARRELAKERVHLTNRLIFLKARLVSGDESVKPAILQAESLLNAVYHRESEGAKIRSRARWLEEGEAPTRFFFKLERERQAKSAVSSILNSDGQLVSSRDEVLKAHVDFYSKLFEEEETDPEALDELLSHVTSHLSDADRDLCDQSLSPCELSSAVAGLSNNKSPGPDGLTAEFYVKFWPRLGPILLQVYNQSLADGELPDSLKESATKVIFKKGDRQNLKNWRPISLLNVDYKIFSKALSLRLAKVLGSIVSPDQTCSVPGRSIVSNLVALRDSLDYIDRTNETGILVSLDQEKAFDRVNRSFLAKLLEHFGFGPVFRNWIFTLYSGAFMRVLVNGFLSDKVFLRRGVRQGDSLSPMLYILCVEVLACKIRDTPEIEGFLLPGARGRQLKVSQYADDTSSLVKSFASLQCLFRVVALYERGTGAKLNLSKTEAMWLGAWKDRPDQPLGLTWVRKMKLLGVTFGVDNVERDNWDPRLSKLDKSLNLWKSRALSLVGKALIVNVLGISKLIYLSQVLIPPRWALDKLNKLVWPFLWGSKIETVARNTLFCPVAAGGLGLIDFQLKSQVLRFKSTLRALSEPSSACFFLTKYFCGGGLSRIRPEWAYLRDILTPSAFFPTTFYADVLQTAKSLSRVAPTFIFSSQNCYRELLKVKSSPPVLPYPWMRIVPAQFSMTDHLIRIRDPITENYKSDILWLITLRGIKVRDALCRWGYTDSPVCAVCPRRETIDHCFLNCPRVKLVWLFFTHLLSAFLLSPATFTANCSSVFFFCFESPDDKDRSIATFLIKSILYAIWKFRNRATFYNSRDTDSAIVKYVLQELKFRLRVDFSRLSRAQFASQWVHPSLCSVVVGNLVINV